MATLTIRQLDEKTKTRLRVRAAHHGRSMEEEAREILRSALSSVPPTKGIWRRPFADGLPLLADSSWNCRDAMLCAKHRDLPNDHP